MSDKINAWCSLWRAQGVGVKTFHALLAAFSSPEAFFNASRAEISAKFPQGNPAQIAAWQKSAGSGARDVQWLEQSPAHDIICWDEARYPALLREIADPPPVLYVLGAPETLAWPQLAIVGSRNASPNAVRTCEDFAGNLAGAGFSICSGLALGIDGAAHRGALRVNGKTVAVVGTGLDRVYPAQHRDLAHQIAATGAIVSEFPIGTGVHAGNFPRRNRLISGLSVGVLVVEASLRSGSLITARLALEQGREVFALPGSIHNPLAKGCHQLIKQGAKLVESADEIGEDLSPLIAAALHHLPVDAAATGAGGANWESLSPACQNLLAVMGFEVCHHDDLVCQLKLTSEEVSAMLSELELEGYLSALGGGLFQRLDAIRRE